MKTILYTNTNTKQCIWQSETYTYSSETSYDYKIMSDAHLLLNDSNCPDVVQGIRFLLKCNGKKLSDV